MKNLFLRTVLGATALALLGACGSTVRSVTHVSTWSGGGGEYVYIGYAENADVSKLRRCNVQPDNSVTCVEEAEVNKLLATE